MIASPSPGLECVNGDSVLRIATKLSEVQEYLKWYSLQIPELTNVQPRVGHALVPLTDGKVLMIGGGNHDGALKEVISVDLQPTPENESEPRVKHHCASESFPARYEFLCVRDNLKNCVWVFGGADADNTTNQIVKIDDDSIGMLDSSKGVLPCPRTQGSNSALVEFKGKRCLAVFGGGLKGEKPVQDRELHLFDTNECKWQKINVKLDSTTESMTSHPFRYQPPLIQGHAITAIGSKVFVHGGINNTTLYDGFHWLDLEKENEDSTYSWIDSSMVDTCSEKPSGRAAHGIARVLDVLEGSPLFFIFGGIGEKGACNDLWSFNADSMSWTRIMKNQGKESFSFYPVPRLDLAMCAIRLKNDSSGSFSVYIMIHGGMSREGEIFNDAWVIKVQ